MEQMLHWKEEKVCECTVNIYDNDTILVFDRFETKLVENNYG